MTWKKYPTDEFVAPADWSDLCGDDPISGAVGVAVLGANPGAVTASILTTTGFVSQVKVTGGTAKTRVNLQFSVNTTGGQKLRPVKTVVVLDPADPSWS